MSTPSLQARLRRIEKIISDPSERVFTKGQEWHTFQRCKIAEILRLCRLPDGTRTVRGWGTQYADGWLDLSDITALKPTERIVGTKNVPVSITYTPKPKARKR